MSDFNAESLSALMDGEAEELEVRRLLGQAAAGADVEITALWSRYHCARAVLQKDPLTYAHIDISASLREQIASEPAYSAAVNSAASEAAAAPAEWQTAFNFKPLAGLAVAASVTAAVFFGVQGLDSAEPVAPQDTLAGNTQLPNAERNVRTLPDEQASERAQVAAAKFETEQRLRMQTLLRLHAQQASLNGSQGILPLARVVSQEVE